MDLITLLFLIIIYIASLSKKKLGSPLKRVIQIINLIALGLTLGLIILWTFKIHLSNLTVEVIPFWIFLASAISIFGLTHTNQIERLVHGFFFWGHLFLMIFLWFPYFGLGIYMMVYSQFGVDSVLFENKKVIVTDAKSGLIAPKPNPTIYLKYGAFSYRFATDAEPIYSIKNVLVKDINSTQKEIIIDGDDRITKIIISFD